MLVTFSLEGRIKSKVGVTKKDIEPILMGNQERFIPYLD